MTSDNFCGLHVSESINQVFGVQPHSLVYIPSGIGFAPQLQGEVAVTGTIWPAKPKIFTMWPLLKSSQATDLETLLRK